MSAMRVGGRPQLRQWPVHSPQHRCIGFRAANPHRYRFHHHHHPQLVPLTPPRGIQRSVSPWIYGVGAVAATSYQLPRPLRRSALHLLDRNTLRTVWSCSRTVCTKEVASAPIGNTQAQLPLPQQQGPTQQ